MKILLVEDNPDHRDLIEEYCYQAFKGNCRITSLDTLDTGLSALYSTFFDVVLIDLSLPDSSVLDTTNTLKDITTSVPIIVLTSLDDEVIGRELIKNGIQDYIAKDNLSTTLLQRIIHYAIERKLRQVHLEERTVNQQTFCRSLSHDFKAPIRNIGQLSTMLKAQLRERNAIEAEDLTLFDKIEGRIDTMNQLVDGLYYYILSEQQHPKQDDLVDFNHLVLELTQLLTNDGENNVSISCGQLPVVRGNSAQLFLLMQNILENAIKFCDKDPLIIITSITHNVGLNSGNRLVHNIQVCDNGVGIDNRYIDNVFEPFRRFHTEFGYQGSGLGLSVVKRIVSNHEGEVTVKSEVGKGTCISLFLP